MFTDRMINKLINSFIIKYNLPSWLKPYIKEYIKKNNNSIRYVVTFIRYGRKKGKLLSNKIILPNGVVFKKKHISHLLNLFYFGVHRMREVSYLWANSAFGNTKLKLRFFEIAEIENKRALTLKNLIEGLNYTLDKKPPSEGMTKVFDYIEKLTDWNERLIAKEIILNYSYAIPFGYIFYKVFYPVSPEFMKKFGKSFNNYESCELLNKKEAEAIIIEGKIDYNKLKNIIEILEEYINESINSEIENAKEAKIYNEIILLKNIAIAYPIYKIKELNPQFDFSYIIDKYNKHRK
ncbi:MAG: hypothetical protein ACP5UN_01570 [Candidatus Micrarchaeia archaeon]